MSRSKKERDEVARKRTQAKIESEFGVSASDAVADCIVQYRRELWRIEGRERRRETSYHAHEYAIADKHVSDLSSLLADAEEQAEQRKKILCAFAELTQDQKNLVLLLRSGKTVGEVASMYGVTSQAISGRLARIRAKFLELL